MADPTVEEITQALIRYNTVNPPGDEAEAQHYLEGLLNRPVYGERHEGVPGSPTFSSGCRVKTAAGRNAGSSPVG